MAGFTLLELLVVLAIIGLLLVATPALISQARPRLDARVATWTLMEDLRAARGLAIASGKETQVVFNIRRDFYTTPPDSTMHRLPKRAVLEFRGPGREVSGSQAIIRFFPDGSSTGGQVRLTSGGSAHRITAHWLTGRISVDD